jgi:molybdate transport system substrate-binding protein
MREFTKTVMTRVCLTLALIALVAQPAHAQADDETLIVFGASSLTEAFEDIAAAFEDAHPGVEVVLNFGSSSTLAAQLAEGAPADVFASANERQMDAARDAGRIAEPIRIFARNRLTLAVPADNPAHIESLIDLAKPGILLVVAAPEVPVRVYTDVMLERLAADPAYGEDYRAAVLANIVSEEDNVRQVIAKIALGEADAGIVYQSDITPDIRKSVTAIPIPDEYNTLAEYPIAVTDDTSRSELAQAFVDFVLSDAGQTALARWGFIPADAPESPFLDALSEPGETTPTPGRGCHCR